MSDGGGGGGFDKGRPKKKRSFLQKAKKFGKQGQRGRGTNIAQDQYDYLVRVLERWRDPFEEDEERKIFVANVFRQMEGDERNFAGNQLASRVIELLIQHADIQVQLQFCEALSQDLRIICTDQFASHVMEKLLILASFSPVDDKTGLVDRLSWVRKVCRYLVNNFNEFSSNTYASHLLRTGVQCMTGARVIDKDKTGQTQGFADLDQFQYKDDPELRECLEILEEKVSDIEASELEDELTSSTVQTVLTSYKISNQTERLRKVSKTLLEKIFYSSLYFLDSQSHVRLLETIIECTAATAPKLFTKLHKKIFAGNLLLIAKHSVGNFVAQRFFENVQSAELFTSCLEEIGGSMEAILSAGLTGVVLAVVKAAVNLKSDQSRVLDWLGSALHCDQELTQIALACIKMMRVDKLEDDLPVHLHGSLILQQLLLFGKPIKVVRSLLGLEGPVLRKIFADPRGSHILDQFATSPTIGEKSREALVRGLSGEMVALSCSKHGSRAMESLWKSASKKSKQVMVEELSQQDSVLKSHQFGKYIHSTCAVSVWKYQREDWDQHVSKAEKERQMFKDIIGAPAKKRKGDWSLGGGPTPKKMEVKSESDEIKLEEPTTPELNENESTQALPVLERGKDNKKKKKKQSYLDDL